MPEWVLQVLVMVFSAGAVYGAIRGDIKAIHESVSEAKAAAVRAHDRIDGLLINRKGQ